MLLYRKLLTVHGTDRWHDLSDEHHVQGAIQLALAHHASELLPEVIGFNLGYEQLPLHLHITAYELKELGVDPHYFSLHLTIDSTSTGHARKSLQCALECLPRAGNAADFYRRMVTGFKLSDLGKGTMKAIDTFDLVDELQDVLVDKASIGAQLHSDCCQIAGRSVAEWLEDPAHIPGFLEALVSSGWIRRGLEPDESRFWRLLHDERAPMFGVFDAYEQQLIADWIVDAPPYGIEAALGRRPGLFPFRPARVTRPKDGSHDVRGGGAEAGGVGAAVRHHLSRLTSADRDDEDVRVLADRLADVDETAVAMAALQGFLSPANHPSPAGLLATRICANLLDR